MKALNVIALLCLSLSLGGCATLTQPDHVPITIRSNRMGAVCTIMNSGQQLKLPATTHVTKRCRDLFLECKHNGETASQSIHYSISKAVIGNVFTGLIGLGIDIASQKACTYPKNTAVDFPDPLTVNTPWLRDSVLIGG